ncbi:MAG: AmmeMemoRadiSam system protein B [Ignavibacteriae bacterium]|nr:AmmeMemoRadiSam system protein B [Ignavibacteriota bacterium]
MSSGSTHVRAPVVAGMFYPAEPADLRREVDDFIHAIESQVERDVKGIIAPHAGYAYSGQTAAHAYAALRGRSYSTVVVIAPSHREFFSGVSVHPGDAYQTPLGLIELDAELREKLITNCEFVAASEKGHRAEHALEVQLPFLQCMLPKFKLLPLVIGDQRPEYCLGLGKALAAALGGANALIVASTDLSHFYSSEVAERIDSIMLDDVGRFDFEQLMRDLEAKRTEACGGGPAVAAMSTAKNLGATKMEVLHYSNSGFASGDFTSVVGYMAAVAY